MTDLLDALDTRAERGAPRGADAVFRAAARPPSQRPDWPRRVALVAAVVVVLAFVAAAVVALRNDGTADQDPVDEVPTPEVGGGEPVEPPLFGTETGTALIFVSDFGEGIAVDLDSGIARSLPGVDDVDDLTVVADSVLVFAGSAGVSSAPLDGSAPATLLTTTPNGREVGSNDTFSFAPSGRDSAFWVESGPIADAPDRSFLAGEHDLSGAMTAPPIDLGRSDRSLRGATANYVLVSDRSEGGEVSVLDHDGGVVRTLPGLIDGGGERIVWTDGLERALHVWDVSSDDERTLGLPEGVDVSFGGQLSPDGSELAVTVQTGHGPVLGVLNIEDGELWVPPSAEIETDFGYTTWSPDGRWVFAGGSMPDTASVVAYRVGDEDATTITLPGLAAWSVVAVPAIPPPSGDVEPCGEIVVDVDPCLIEAFAGAVGPQPVDTDDPTVTTTIDGAVVASPIERAQINVIVADGSEVEGAASRVADTLTSIGYLRPLTIDANVAAAQTPLDTVYYATEPDTQPQADQVAEDLGLPANAVMPYPTENAPADIGLAQVLVVLGSTPGSLAFRDVVTLTPTGGPASTVTRDDVTVRISPGRNLDDGHTVGIQGAGAFPTQEITATQCGAERRGEDGRCDESTTEVLAFADGAFDGSITVRRVLDTADGSIDCREVDCIVEVRGVGIGMPIHVPITFA